MKKVVLFCDRCGENKPTPATTLLRIAIVGRKHSVRLDVCEGCRAIIFGDAEASSTNGTSPAPAEATQRAMRPGSKVAKAMAVLRPLFEKRPRYDIEELLTLTKVGKYELGYALRALVDMGTIRMAKLGVYVAQSAPPLPARDDATIDREILTLVKRRPGMRSAYVSGLLDLELPIYQRATLRLLDAKKIRFKGSKGTAQVFPIG